MITVSNYASQKSNIDWSKLPKEVKQLEPQVESWFKFYDKSEKIKATVDLYIKQVNTAFAKAKKAAPKKAAPKKAAPKKAAPKKAAPKKTLINETDYSILKKYAFAAKHPLVVLDQDSPQFKSAFQDFLKEVASDGEESKSGDWKLIKRKTTSKKAAPKKAKKLTVKVDAKTVDNYDKEFMLVRRFYNAVKKAEVLDFRKLQLLYMAFQKAVVGRDVRKTSSSAKLFTEVNEMLVKMYNLSIDKGRRPVEPIFTNKNFIPSLEKHVKGRKVNYAVTLLRSYINLQGTDPGVEKAKRLYKRFDNAEKRGKVTKDNRLYDEFNAAARELNDYIKLDDPIDTDAFGLTGKASKVCDNRIKCKGLDKNGQLEKGYYFTKGGKVAKAKPAKKKKGKLKPLAQPASTATPIVAVPAPPPPPPAPAPAKKMKPATTLPGLRRMDAPTEKSPLWQIPGATGEFLQQVERKKLESVAIVFSTPPGTGKTTTLYKWMNDIAPVSPTLFLSLEEHPDSNLATDKRDKYLSPEAQANMNTAGSVPDKPTLIKWIKAHDVIAIDSWQKLVELIGPTKFDQELRKAFNGKLFIIIFQETTTGRAKGGADKVFDGDIIIKGHKGERFVDNYLYPEKHRYTTVPLDELRYMIDAHQVINPKGDKAQPEAQPQSWLSAQ